MSRQLARHAASRGWRGRGPATSARCSRATRWCCFPTSMARGLPARAARELLATRTSGGAMGVDHTKPAGLGTDTLPARPAVPAAAAASAARRARRAAGQSRGACCCPSSSGCSRPSRRRSGSRSSARNSPPRPGGRGARRDRGDPQCAAGFDLARSAHPARHHRRRRRDARGQSRGPEPRGPPGTRGHGQRRGHAHERAHHDAARSRAPRNRPSSRASSSTSSASWSARYCIASRRGCAHTGYASRYRSHCHCCRSMVG